MNKILMTGLFLFASKVMQGVANYQGAAEDLTKLKLATVYLQAVKISRLFFISLLGSGLCLLLLFIGLVLINCTVFLYAPWSDSTKAIVTLISAGSYILIAGGIFIYVFAEDKWIKMLNTQSMIEELTGKS